MAPNATDQQEIRLYLLGLLEPEPLAERVEERMLTEPDYYEEILVAEDELIDQYLSGEFPAGEREAFERYFLLSPARVKKLRFARALDRYVSPGHHPAPGPVPRRGARVIFGALWGSPARAAAFALVVSGFALVAWLAYVRSGSAFDEGLAALHAAYRERRPVEARMAGFDYARWYVTRDGSGPTADAVTLDRAEFLLRDAANKHPGPGADHALGSLYLAKRQYDQALALLEKALRADERNPRLHNDLGVALFEQGLGRGNGGGGKDLEALSRSAEHFVRAVELDDSFLEARFNLALAQQELMQWRQAEEGWREYLRRDDTSRWADEARGHLKEVEEHGRSTSRDEGQAPREFLDAWRAGDEAAAWGVVSRSYTSSGNEVANGLLDSLLAPASAEDPAASGAALPALSYLARLESERADDRFVSDLVLYYERTTPSQRPLLAEARAHIKAGQALFANIKFAEAVGEFTAARLAYERAGDPAGAALAEYRLAHSHVLMDDLEKARLAFERLHAACEAKHYRWVAARTLYGLAHVSTALGQYSKAADYSGRALDGFERGEDLDGQLRSLTQLADINETLGRAERALGYLGRALALAAQPSVRPMERWAFLTQIAFSLDARGLKTAALFYQKEALGIAQESAEPLRLSRSYGYVGTAYASLKMYTEAVKNAARAFEIGAGLPEGQSRRELMANASLYLGDIFRQAGDCAKALEAYDRSIRLYGGLEIEYYSYPAHKGRLLCLNVGADDRAVGEELQTIFALFDQHRSNITAESQRVSFFDKEQVVYDLAIAHEVGRVGDSVKAFEYSEESRARSLYDAIARGAEVLKKGYGPDVNLPAAARPLTLGEVQAGMPARAQILQYAVLEDRLLIWVVTKSGPLHQIQVEVGERALKEKVSAYLAAASKPPAGDDDDGGTARLAGELYQTLVAPAEPYLDRSGYLCVVADKALHFLPFAALVSQSGRYLMEDYEVGSAPSSTIFVSTSAAAAARGGASEEGLLSVGDPSFSRSAFPSMPELRSAAREAEQVSQFYKPRSILLGPRASEQQVKAELSKAEVAHLAMHFVVSADSELLSGFPLAAEAGSARGPQADGFLQFHELYGLKLPRTRLVVLSACETGVMQAYAGEGAVGVTRPFLVAGVPVVVASLWPVDSDATAELMVSFHRLRTRGGLTTARALARAQSEMARGPDPRYRHPFYWAAFLAVGGQTTF